MYFTQVNSSLTRKHKIRMERLAKDKPFSLLQTFAKYVHKRLYNIGPKCQLCS